MTIRRIASAALAVILLVPCTSCNLAMFDQDEDGTVTRDEIVATLTDFFCGEDQGTNDGTTDNNGTDDGTTDNGSTDNGTPDNTDNGTTDTGSQR